MCRVSSDEQAKGYSLDIQQENLVKYCGVHQIEIVKIYREDHSAKNFNRPEFSSFLKYAEKSRREIDLLLCTTWDRFSRNATDSFVMIRKLESMGIEVQAIEQPIDFSVPEMRAMLALYLTLPEIDNTRRSMKIKEGMRGALKAGRWCRMAPIGYVNCRDGENKPIIIPGPKAKFIRRAFKLIAEGKCQSDVIRELSVDGIKISRNGMSKLLRNPVYIGKILIPQLMEEQEREIDGIHDPIISENLFFKVQAVLDGRNKTIQQPSKTRHRAELPLRGILNCGSCENKMTGSASRSRNGTRHYYYHCNHCGKSRIRAPLANEQMGNILNSFSFSDEVQEVYDLILENELKNRLLTDSENVPKLLSKKEKLEEKVERIRGLLLDEQIDPSDYGEIRSDLLLQIESVENDIKKASTNKSSISQMLKSTINLVKNLSKAYSMASVEQKQRILSSIFPERIVMSEGHCRTSRMNEAVRLIANVGGAFGTTKKGRTPSLLEFSPVVEPGGVEPPSKQATIRTSTCLSYYWFSTSD